MEKNQTDISFQVAEHAMRISTDFHLIVELLSLMDATSKFEIALGKVMSESNKPLRLGTPLSCALDGSPINPAWRSFVQSVPSSVWSELETMRSIYGNKHEDLSRSAPVASKDGIQTSLHPLLNEVMILRTLADSDLMGID